MITVIKKTDVKELLNILASEWNVYAPLNNIGGDITIEQLPKDPDARAKALEHNIALENTDTVISQKNIFFPQLEALLQFNKSEIKGTTAASKILLFGIKPCDLQGMLFADSFFKRNYEDIYYLNRILDRFIIAVGCNTPPRPNACFCTSVKTGPFAEKGFDLQFIDFGDSYFVEIGSENGAAFIDKHNKYFIKPDRQIDNDIKSIKQQAQDAVALKVDFQKALNLMSQSAFLPDEIYKRISERCIYCGGCMYVCPTCTCFNVFDNSKDCKGERVRIWDTCVFEGYTREASGHNPRKDKSVRTSRRYEHKLKYDYKITGVSGCIGCGRCLSNCPVEIGISKFIQEITEDKRTM